MSTYSEILLPNQSHLNDDIATAVVGEKFKGDGFYSRADGLHTVQWSITEFIGIITIQAALAVTPEDADWFRVNFATNNEYSVDTTGLVSTAILNEINYFDETSGSFSYNFTGNYTWVRASINNWTHGSVGSILLSH